MNYNADDSDYPVILGFGSAGTLNLTTSKPRGKGWKQKQARKIKLGFQLPKGKKSK